MVRSGCRDDLGIALYDCMISEQHCYFSVGVSMGLGIWDTVGITSGVFLL